MATRITAGVLLSCLAALASSATAAGADTWTLQDFWPRWARVDEKRVKVGTSHVYRFNRETQIGANAFSTQVTPHVPPLISCSRAGVVGSPTAGIDFHLWDSTGYHYLGYVLYNADCSFHVMAVQNPTAIVIMPLTVDDEVGWFSGPLARTSITQQFSPTGERVGPSVTTVRRFNVKIALDPDFTDPVLKVAAWDDDNNCQADTLWLGRTSPVTFDRTTLDSQGIVKMVAASEVPAPCTLADYSRFLFWSDPLP